MCLELACRIDENAKNCSYSDTTSAAYGITCDSGKVIVFFFIKINILNLKLINYNHGPVITAKVAV